MVGLGTNHRGGRPGLQGKVTGGFFRGPRILSCLSYGLVLVKTRLRASLKAHLLVN